MRPLRFLLAGIVFSAHLWAGGAVVTPPAYISAGIVNAASYKGEELAPNAIATIFGTNLCFGTAALTSADTINGGLPISLGGTSVFVGGVLAGLYFVSPTQINFLIPNILTPATVQVEVVRESVAGPNVTVTLHQTGPAFFQNPPNQIIATHLDGSLVDSASPGSAGEWIVIYGDGLGRTSPDAGSYSFASGITPIQAISDFSVLLNGVALPVAAVNYAGLAPGFAGLYQINVQLPVSVAANPQLQISTGSVTSPAQTWLAVK